VPALAGGARVVVSTATLALQAQLVDSDLPRLADAVAFLSCEAVEERPAGDHVLVICRVLEVTCDDGRLPLVFYDGAFGSFAAA